MAAFKQYHPAFGDVTMAPWKEGSQVIKTRLYLEVTLKLVDSGTQQRSVLVALAADGKGNTLFEPGLLQYNQHDKLGWWTDNVVVEIVPNKPYMALDGSWPTTLNASGETSSSEGFSLGFFGDTATGGVNASQSAGHGYKDFTLFDTSDGKTLSHRYQMSLCADGSPYASPADMAPDAVIPTEKTHLHGAPPLATSSFPLIDMGIWTTQPGSHPAEKVSFLISIMAQMGYIEGTASVFGGITKDPRKSALVVAQRTFEVDLSDVS